MTHAFASRSTLRAAVLLAALVVGSLARAGSEPFTSLTLPREWSEKFWATPGARALVELEPGDLAARVPVQAGFRYVRCPSCFTADVSEPLAWSPDEPDALKCEHCSATFTALSKPAESKPTAAAGTELIEVRPGVTHKYPYWAIDPAQASYPEERAYLSARRDFEARVWLAKAALYAAMATRPDGPIAPGSKARTDPAASARAAAILVIRFAQVYPDYASHLDLPGRPKDLGPAHPIPPYRRGYATGKWTNSGAEDMPLNLLIAYAIVRDTPAWAEAARSLNLDPEEARRVVETDLLRASVEFTRNQPEEMGEASLTVYRGMLAVGRLLNDPSLVHEAIARLNLFAERGFSHDGLWRGGDGVAHRRVLAQIDGWIDRLLAGYSDPPSAPMTADGRRYIDLPGTSALPVLLLAREAGAARPWAAGALGGDGIQAASWPPPRVEVSAARRPALLGGAGVARLGVGSGSDALDLELRGLGTFDTPRSARLSLRARVAGRAILDDLDEAAPRPDGLELATASHNTVLIDGRNQREDLDLARVPAPASDLLFFAAAGDFQVAAMEDHYAYPRSGTKYRQIVVVAAGRSTRYAVSLFEVEGGHQHDQMWYAPADEPDTRWIPPATAAASVGPATLLGPTYRYLPAARAEQGRWFVQALGSIGGMSQARLDHPTSTVLSRRDGTGLRLHLLGDVPAQAVVGRAPGVRDDDRAALVLRRVSDDGRTLHSTFVGVLEPIAAAIPPLIRVGRVESPPGSVVLLIRTSEGEEHLVLNLQAGKEIQVRLADNRPLATDGLAVRVRGADITLAGGTRVDIDGVTALQRHRAAGSITGILPDGGFLADTTLAEPDQLAGQALIIRHGDRTARAWTIVQAVNLPGGSSRIHVREATGFALDPATGEAQYTQFPRTRHPAPHSFVISGMARADSATK